MEEAVMRLSNVRLQVRPFDRLYKLRANVRPCLSHSRTR
nr:MAG TPA: hypothetical protein [Bacteriophage sp.]